MSLFSIGGLVSGLDTKGIIDQLLALRARPITSFETKKTVINQKQKLITEIGARVASLRTLVSSLKLTSNINKKTVSTSMPSTATGLLGATASASAANQTFKVTIKQLATETSVKSTSSIGTSVTATALLTGATQNDFDAATTGTGLSEKVTAGTFTVGRDGTLSSFTIDGTSTLNSVVTALNATFGVGFAAVTSNKLVFDISAGGGGTTFNIGTAGDTSNFLDVMGLTDAIRDPGTAATVTGAAVAANPAAASLTMIINGVTITVPDPDVGTAAQNAAKIVAYINQQTGSTDVTASIAGTDQVRLTQTTGGTGNNIVISYADVDTGLTAGTTSGTDLNTIRSVGPLGIAQAASPLEDARFGTAITPNPGTGSFTINGVSFSYDPETTSLNDIISDINASAAGVTASYDPVEDKFNLRATGTGSESIKLANVTGNFLTVVGVLSATQSLGNNAKYSINTLAGGADQTSASNNVLNALPGVNLELKQADEENEITVTVSQDVSATVSLVQSYVEQFNAVAGMIEEAIKFDPDTKEKGLLVGDSLVIDILRNIQSLTVGPGNGLTGEFTSLGEVGLEFKDLGDGKLELELDSTALSDALKESPNAVSDLFTKRETSSALTTTAGNIASISGTEDNVKRAGVYTFTIDTAATPNLTVTFNPDDSTTDVVTKYSVTAGSTNTQIIPGITITFAGALVNGSDTITVTVPTKGIAQMLDDYLNPLGKADGVFDARKDRSTAEIEDLDERISKLRQEIEIEEQNLIRQFSRLEGALVRLNQQQASLASLVGMPAGGAARSF